MAITQDLLQFINAAPTPLHTVAEVAKRLRAQHFTPLEESSVWQLEPGGSYFVSRDGALLAFRLGEQPARAAGFRMVAAHTDSPTLRIKPNADVYGRGYTQLGVEVYGGALTHTWLDRDLGLAGRVALRTTTPTGPSVEEQLVHLAEPLLRIPSLAIHLHRDVLKEGLKLNEQTHLMPVLAVAPIAAGEASPAASPGGTLRQLLAARLAVDAARLLSWDLVLIDTAPPVLGGLNQKMIFAPRLDNLTMCHAGLQALLNNAATATAATRVLCLYDHEEVGSASTSGAAGQFAEAVLRRIAETEGPAAQPGDLARAAARSLQVSADMAHAVHPNFADKHDPQHGPQLNGGPVIKFNAQQRYATCSRTAALFEILCQESGVPYQKFVSRSDLPCGSTLGPLAATRLGIRTVDVGNAMLSMHSVREQAGADDPAHMVAVLSRFFLLS